LVRRIEKHYGALVDGTHAAITDRLDAAYAMHQENRGWGAR
jgi:hypothetical protein